MSFDTFTAVIDFSQLYGGDRPVAAPAIAACHASSDIGATHADVAQLAERDLAMVEATGSSPVVRFTPNGSHRSAA